MRLTSSEDVDIRLLDQQTRRELVAWPEGLLSEDTEACTHYQGLTYCYSGYNGTQGRPGHEWIRIRGTTNRPLVMQAYGYAAGTASVDYSWGTP